MFFAPPVSRSAAVDVYLPLCACLDLCSFRNELEQQLYQIPQDRPAEVASAALEYFTRCLSQESIDKHHYMWAARPSSSPLADSFPLRSQVYQQSKVVDEHERRIETLQSQLNSLQAPPVLASASWLTMRAGQEFLPRQEGPRVDHSEHVISRSSPAPAVEEELTMATGQVEQERFAGERKTLEEEIKKLQNLLEDQHSREGGGDESRS